MTIIESQIIKFLRLPLIVLIVSIHSQIYFSDINILFPIFCKIQYFVTQIARVAVPLFFFFSGYLYFNNIHVFNKKVYFEKCKYRFKTLLIPYIIFNTMFIIYTIVFHRFIIIGNELNLVTILKSYLVVDNFSTSENLYPALYPLWFLRDLLFLSIITPIIWFFLKKTKGLFIIIIFFICFYSITNIPYMNKLGLFCFSLGAFLSIYKISFIKYINSIPYVLITILFFAANIFGSIFNPSLYIFHQLKIFISIIFILNSVNKLVLKDIKIPIILSNSSFFIYLSHVPLVEYVRRFTLYIFQPFSTVGYTLSYLCTTFNTVSICILMYLFLKKYFPYILNTLTGNRD